MNLSALGERIVKVRRSLTLKDKFVISILLFSLLAEVVSTLALVTQIPASDSLIPLHYNIYFGVDYIDEWYKIFFLPLFGLLVLVTNFVFIYLLYLKERFLSYCIAATIGFVHIVILVSTYLLIYLNS